ncbi:hypothetical protein POPTR_003G126001v4 [Populus trichocarpa]|uniref:Uncharacterized protein n=1 Tax=Populus trichocarpa TaxID=3694 RepID=A0ACC0T971_POPTR|nr:hypothetical protein BDE02_03G113800 [Populus trichocarpa]KAI9398107.1 hypothetical protein POPTR_003G126001v4 [Populus trichocarpa]
MTCFRQKVQKNCICRCVHCYGNCILKPRTRITIHQLRQYFIHYVPPHILSFPRRNTAQPLHRVHLHLPHFFLVYEL